MRRHPFVILSEVRSTQSKDRHKGWLAPRPVRTARIAMEPADVLVNAELLAVELGIHVAPNG
jgi:hypothetical protein